VPTDPPPGEEDRPRPRPEARAEPARREEDGDLSDAQALSRATGGVEDDAPDATATTGTGESGTSVGRVAGQDVGYAGETGAERRAEGGSG
jgi:hypothetical protein